VLSAYVNGVAEANKIVVWTVGASVALKTGTADAAKWQGKAGTGEYQSLPLIGVEENATVSVKYSGMNIVKSVKAVKKKGAPAGILNGLFSVSENHQVRFSHTLAGAR